MKLTWSDLISIVFPGSILLLGISSYYLPLNNLVVNPEKLTVPSGLVLLFFSGIFGGILEGIRRIIFDEIIDPIISKISKRLKGGNNKEENKKEEKGLYYYLSPHNLELFKEGVASSYKYYTFYANLSIAILSLIVLRFTDLELYEWIILLVISILLFLAARIQNSYFNQFISGFIEREKDYINN